GRPEVGPHVQATVTEGPVAHPEAPWWLQEAVEVRRVVTEVLGGTAASSHPDHASSPVRVRWVSPAPSSRMRQRALWWVGSVTTTASCGRADSGSAASICSPWVVASSRSAPGTSTSNQAPPLGKGTRDLLPCRSR